MYWIFNGMIFGSEKEAKEAKKELIANGMADEHTPIVAKKLW